MLRHTCGYALSNLHGWGPDALQEGRQSPSIHVRSVVICNEDRNQKDDLGSRGERGCSTRKRMNLNLHAELSDPISRFINAGHVGTYVRPHRHRIGRWELVSVLQGSLDLVIFTSGGQLKDRFTLSAEGTSLAEIPGGDWHTFVFHSPAAVVLEVKPGPYEPQFDKEFADWAPAEGDPTAALFVTWLNSAELGDLWRTTECGNDHA
jgi:cupin fold WbuC family metalloprotein